MMKNKEMVHLGHRSHPDLMRLDKLKPSLSYPGWKADFNDAEETHVSDRGFFKDQYHKLTERQRMHDGNRTHRRLVELDSLSWSYTGWEEDFRKAEEAHVDYEGAYGYPGFSEILQMMKKKQMVHLGHRSHRDLMRLDVLKPSLSYPGWEADFNDAEETHMSYRGYFKDQYHKLTERQRMHDGNRSHRRLVDLDSLSWSYTGWEEDFRTAEEAHVKYEGGDGYPGFSKILQKMRIMQQLFDEIRPGPTSNLSSNLPQQTMQVQSTTSQSDAGVSCMAAPKSHAFVPCGHLCACKACATESFQRSNLCPICRGRSQMVKQIFFS
jgi:hypothetical protein